MTLKITGSSITQPAAVAENGVYSQLRSQCERALGPAIFIGCCVGGTECSAPGGYGKRDRNPLYAAPYSSRTSAINGFGSGVEGVPRWSPEIFKIVVGVRWRKRTLTPLALRAGMYVSIDG